MDHKIGWLKILTIFMNKMKEIWGFFYLTDLNQIKLGHLDLFITKNNGSYF